MTTDKSSYLVPKLRFPEFQRAGDWKLDQIGNVASISKGKHVSKADITKEGATPCIRYAELYTHYSEVIHEVVSRTNVPHEDLMLSQAEDVIVPASGETKVDIARAACIMPVSVALGGDLNVLRSDLYGPFLSYLLNSPLRHTIARMAQGDTVAHLYPKQLSQVWLAYPSRLEQQRIADCLVSLDELIAAKERKLEALRQHKQGLMQQLFPQPGETVPRLRFPEFRHSSNWKTGRCRDIARVLPGYGFPDKFQGNEKGQFPFYKVSDISRTVEEREKYISKARNYVESDVLDEIRGKPVPTGTIIFAKIGEAIRSNRRVVTTTPAVIDNNTAGVKAIETKSSDEFLFYLWSNVSLIDHAGGVVPAVSKSALENVPLCYPSDPEEQQSIADCLGSLDNLITVEGRMLEALRHHKQGLMQQLFPSLEGNEQ